jgi:hypothetical protein
MYLTIAPKHTQKCQILKFKKKKQIRVTSLFVITKTYLGNINDLRLKNKQY